jgi:hypothetical protein
MSYRLVGRAEDRIDAVLLESARRVGIDVAARYNRLIIAVMTAVGGSPGLPGSREIPRVAGVRTFHLRSARLPTSEGPVLAIRKMAVCDISCRMDMTKALAELPILRGFIDFVNLQVGVYCDCLSGFQGNKVRIERQAARVLHPASRRIENGQPVIVWASVEDPARPDVIHHRTFRADDFVAVNSEAGFNERQTCWSIIVFVYAYWDEETRWQIAKIRGVEKDEVRVDVFGDLRLLRRSIIHDGGVLKASDHVKLKVLSNLFQPGTLISPTHDEMHKIFVAIKSAIGDLILEYTGHLPGAPKPGEVVEVAIQGAGGV